MLIAIAGIAFLCGCEQFTTGDNKKKNALARVNDKYLYKYEIATGVYTVMHQFPHTPFMTGPDGETSWASLVEARDHRLYGTTLYGGSGGKGTVFRLEKDGTGYEVLVEFTGPDAEAARSTAMQVAAMRPVYVTRDEVPADAPGARPSVTRICSMRWAWGSSASARPSARHWR